LFQFHGDLKDLRARIGSHLNTPPDISHLG
jgi:hypothetical protein